MSNSMSNSNIFASNTTEKGDHDIQRMKQATGAAQDKASSNASTYVDQVKGTASDVVASVQGTASQAAIQTNEATDNFLSQATSQTNEAANEGQNDVEAMKTTGEGYVDQAKSLTEKAFSTIQGYVFGSDGNSENAPQSGGIPSLHSTANAATETSKTHMASAQAAMQPHLQYAQKTIQPYLQSAQDTVQPHVQSAINTAKPYAEKAQSTLGSAFASGGNEKTPSS